MSVRVREAAVRVRVPIELEDQRDDLKRTVTDRLLVRLLEELDRRLTDRFGAAAVVRIRVLPLSCSLDTDELDEPATASQLATDLAVVLIRDLEHRSPPEKLRPAAEQTVVVFADEHHADAAALAALSDALEPSWIHRDATPSLVWSRVVGRGAAAICATLDWLRRMERLERVIDALPVDTAMALVEVIAVDERPPALTRVIARGSAPAPIEVAALPAELVPRTPSVAEAEGHTPARVESVAEAPRSPDDAVADPGPTRATTSVAGLFYLAGRVLEIDLAERLWSVGVVEGDVLFHIATLLAGDDELGCRWFGGAFDRTPSTPDVPMWAVAEVNEQVMHALGRRLVHFGVERTPEQLDRELEALAATAQPATSMGAGLAAVVRRSAAALAYLVSIRLGLAPSIAIVRGLSRRPGQLVLEPDVLLVSMDRSLVDLDHRRAGLDHDPGHIPWIGRHLRFVFTGHTSI